MKFTGVGLAFVFTGWGLPIAGTPLQYSPDYSYVYRYATQITFNEPGTDAGKSQAHRDVGVKVTATVTLSPVWYSANNMLVKLQVINQLFTTN